MKEKMAIGDYSTLTVLLNIEGQKYKVLEQDQQMKGTDWNGNEYE